MTFIDIPDITDFATFRERKIEELTRHYHQTLGTEKRAHIKGKPVIVNGKRYGSITLAAKDTGMGHNTLWRRLCGITVKGHSHIDARYA